MNEQMQMGQQKEEKVVLTIGDIATMVQIVDVCSRRGAINGGEMAGVGMLRNKLEAYVRQNAPEGTDAEASMPIDDPMGGDLADRVVS